MLAGSGSSAAAPLLRAWSEEFNRHHPNTHVGYLASSTTEGIDEITRGRGDFAVGETSLTTEQWKTARGRLIQIPVAVGSVVPVYNVPRAGELRFTGDLLAQIYMGNVSNWSDQRIARLNPGMLLPDLAIAVLQRPETSGSRQIFTKFLLKTSPAYRLWSANGGQPGGLPQLEAERSQGLAEKVAMTPGAIGYLERGIASHYGLTYGSVRNASGKFAKASTASVTAACLAMENTIVKDGPGSLVNAPGESSCPLTHFVWIYVPISDVPVTRHKAFLEFLHWCLQQGQMLTAGYGYLPLPSSAATKAERELRSIFP